MSTRRLSRLLGGLALAAGLISGAAQAAPVLSGLVADNGTLSGPQAYTLGHASHTVGAAFTDSYRFTLGTDWKVNEVNSYFNAGGGMLDFAVRLYGVVLNQETLIASDLTPTVGGLATVYSFDVTLAQAGDYRLEVSGTRLGLDYSGTFTLFTPQTARVPEPAGLALVASALLALGWAAARRRRGMARA